MLILLDGPIGTELAARGVSTPLPLWSAEANITHPEVVAEIHRAYAAIGATVHTANTFRTKRRQAGDRWELLARRAVEIARASILPSHRLAGSIAPLEDCYRPDRSPPEGLARAEHRELARMLAALGVDLLLCETFAHVGEALIAVEEAVATGVETWVAFSAGPNADLLTPEEIHAAARSAAERGARALLVNCIPASKTLPFVSALAGLGLPFGAYANAGAVSEGLGFGFAKDDAPSVYVDYAREWVAAGATLIGGCCGTGPAHLQALAKAFHFDQGPCRA